MTYAIEGRRLHKTFVKQRSIRELVQHPFSRAKRLAALRGVDIDVREGEIFGLLGPNGAGKTTLLKILCCLVLPDEGQAFVRGEDVIHENRVKRLIGLVHSDERSFYWRLSARENLRFFARLYDVPARRVDERIDRLLARIDMREAADRPFSGYSSGMKQRIAVARALLHDPPILLMDEPTRSLDPASALSLRQLIGEELNRRDGKTILLATHHLREAETLSDRVAILVRGRVRRVGTVAEVRLAGLRGRTYRLEVEASPRELPGFVRVLSDRLDDDTRKLTVTLDEPYRLNDLLRALLDRGFTLRGCDRVEPDLEEAFARALEDGADAELSS